MGFGDVVARTYAETCFAIVFCFLSDFLVFFVVSNFELMISNNSMAKVAHMAKVVRFEKYAKLRSLSSDVVARVKSYYDHQWTVLGGIDEKELLSMIPINMQHQIRRSIMLQLFSGVPIVKDLDNQALARLCFHRDVEVLSHSPGHILIPVGSDVKGLYLVLSGQLVVTYASDTQAKHFRYSMISNDNKFTRVNTSRNTMIKYSLQWGHFFGLAALDKQFVAMCDVSAVTYVEVVFVPISAVREVVDAVLSPSEIKSLAKMFSMETINTSDVNTGIKSDNSLAKLTFKSIKFGLQFLDDDGSRAIKSLLHPDSAARQLWDSLMLLVLYFLAVSIPILLSGCIQDDFQYRYLPLLAMSYTADILMLMNTIGQMYLFQTLEADGATLISDPKQLLLDFFSQERRPIILILAHLPIDIVMALAFNSPAVIPIVRSVKFLHFRHVSRYRKRFSNVMFRLGFVVSAEVSRTIDLALIALLVCHFAACVWLFAADFSTIVMGYQTNRRQFDVINPESNISDAHFLGFDPYFRSFYWCLSVMITVGYSNILPTNNFEIATCIFIMFLVCLQSVVLTQGWLL